MAKEVISLSGLVSFFKEDPNVIGKGELKYNSDFVLDLGLIDHTIIAKVRASMKDKSYSLSLTVTGDGGISSAVCQCPRGNWICSHMAAAAIYVKEKGLSKTDLPNSWISKPKKAAKIDSKTFADFFPHPKPENQATTRMVTQQDKEFFHERLVEANTDCPLQWMSGPEPDVQLNDPDAPCLIEDILNIFFSDKAAFIEKCKVSREQIFWLASKTVEQRNSLIWGQFHRLRLTGNNFGEVLKASQRHDAYGAPYPPSLFKKLKGEYSLGTKDAIMWGQMHEAQAIQDYMQKTGNKVKQAGLYLFPCGFLGSSPDGIIELAAAQNDHGVLEIKCPWKYRNNTIEEILQIELGNKEEKDSFYLTKCKKLQTRHNFWQQVQAEIVAVNVSWAHFVVWTTKDICIITVEKDPEWEQKSLPVLKNFYINELIPSCYTRED